MITVPRSINTRKVSLILILYFSTLLILSPIALLSFDTFYYWDWSRHLALSYYDGSPMIAYFIKLATLLFGDTLFALNFIGIFVTALTSVIIYKTARLFLEKEASYISMLLWLFSPLVSMDLLKQTTYDTPLTLFWALTVYHSMQFIKFANTRSIYWVGICIGLMLLSKYAGLVLIIALVIFLTTTHYRYLFKTRHFYFALLLSLLIFSPVILWNYQHEWQSFIYQWTTHQSSNTVNPLIHISKTFFIIFLPSLNFMLLPPFLCWMKQIEKNSLFVTLCRIICITFLCFYLLVASKAQIREYWLAPYLITSALLAGYCYQTVSYCKSMIFIIAVYGIVSFAIVLNNTYEFSLTTSKKLIAYRLIQQLNADYPQLPKTILTSGWFEARQLFFLKNKPYIYTLGCDTEQNQYAYWSTTINQQIVTKSLKEAFYFDSYERSSCLKKYFDKCVRLPTQPYSYKDKSYEIYAYKCSNNFDSKLTI